MTPAVHYSIEKKKRDRNRIKKMAFCGGGGRFKNVGDYPSLLKKCRETFNLITVKFTEKVVAPILPYRCKRGEREAIRGLQVVWTHATCEGGDVVCRFELYS